MTDAQEQIIGEIVKLWKERNSRIKAGKQYNARSFSNLTLGRADAAIANAYDKAIIELAFSLVKEAD